MGDSIPLFCIASVSSEAINTLLQTPKLNPFVLIRDPAQQTYDAWSTDPSVQPFESGFIGWTSNQIRTFTDKQMYRPEQNLAPGIYALLDERSESDNTVVIGHAYSKLHDRDPELMTEDEWYEWGIQCDNHDVAPNAWFEWRVRFADVQRLHTAVAGPTDFAPKLYREDYVAAWTDERGVVRVEDAWQAYLREAEGRARADENEE